MRKKYTLEQKYTFNKTRLSRAINMRLMLVCMCMIPFFAGASPQKESISLNLTNVTINSALEELGKTGDYLVMIMDDAKSDLNKRIDVRFENSAINTILDFLIKGTNLSYTITKKQITVQKKPTPATIRREAAPRERELGKQNKSIRTIKGIVTDENGDPLISASISILRTAFGAMSGVDGSFSFAIPGDYTGDITISYLAYETLELPVANTDYYQIVLKADAHGMDDIIVNSYFTRKKEGFAGTAVTIGREELKRAYTGNLFTTLSSLDASFRVIENDISGSNPNVMPEFNIRGRGSFQGNSSRPLFILDGIEVPMEGVYDLDQNRIETITLLKDASATILYGSRAANGVVVIETVAPKSGEIRITYDFKSTLAVADLSGYDLMNAREKLEYEKLAGVYDYTNFIYEGELEDNYKKDILYNTRLRNVLEGVNTDWIYQPIKNSFSQNHSLYVEGGAETIRYGIDLGYGSNNGIMKGSSRDKLSLGFTLIYRIRDKITLRNMITYSEVDAKDSPYGSFYKYTTLNPYERIRDNNNQLTQIFTDEETPNPIYDAQLPFKSRNKTDQVKEHFSIDWHITQDVRLRGQIAINKSKGKYEYYKSPYSTDYILKRSHNSITGLFEKVPLEDRGELQMRYDEEIGLESSVSLDYSKLLNNKHLLYLGGGVEIRTNEDKSSSYEMTGFTDDRYADPGYAIQYKKDSRPSSFDNKERAIGFFSNFNYIFDQRLFADLSIRYDGSSKFGKNKRFAPFWSVGGGWNVHNESFMKGTIFNMLRIRGSYGVTGNVEFDAFQAKTRYQYNLDRLYYKMIGATIMAYGNNDLKWQETHQANIGLDVAFLNNRIKLGINYYDKKTENLLTDITVAPSLGFPGNSFKANLGTITNKGIDFTAGFILVNKPTDDLNATLNIQGLVNRNKITKISNSLKGLNDSNNEGKFIPGAVYEEGHSLSAIKAVRSLGIDPLTGKELFIKANGERTYIWDAADKVFCGDNEPKISGNIGGNIYWKGFNFNFAFYYSLGAYKYNQTLVDKVENIDPKYNADRRALTNRWNSPGDHALYKDIRDTGSTYISDRFVQKENLFRLTTISLSYEFPRALIKNLHIQSLRLNMYMTDVFRASSIKEERGTDYPFQRSFIFGINISF